MAGDLVGCRFRQVQRRAHPEVPATPAGQERASRFAAARRVVLDNLPAAGKNFRRIDLGFAEGEEFAHEMATLEALATGADLITGGLFAYHGWRVTVDALLKAVDGYVPVLVSNHRVARRHPEQCTPGVPTHRLGLSEPLDLPYRLRHHVADGYRLGLAARALAESGLDSGRGAVVGQDRHTAFFVDTARYQPALQAALDQVPPAGPRRVKECATCRFWDLCRPQLEARDDISLFLSGDKARPFRERGIDTVGGLIAADLGEPSRLASAWRDGEVLLRRGEVTVPRADVEVDIDMEAYLDQGAYLWGTWHAGQYRPFVTWQPLGGAAEAENFWQFWQWLQALRANAHARGQTFAAYCYSAHGENHWMRLSAKRFGRPTLTAMEEFLASPEWVDMFAHVKASFAGPYGLGLKVVAPEAGHAWPEDDFDGEDSVAARRAAVHGDATARSRLLAYNEGDVVATARVREWMSAGAPGTGLL